MNYDKLQKYINKKNISNEEHKIKLYNNKIKYYKFNNLLHEGGSYIPPDVSSSYLKNDNITSYDLYKYYLKSIFLCYI